MTYYINPETQEIFSKRRKNLQENTENFQVFNKIPSPKNIAIDEYIKYGVKEEEGVWSEDWKVLKLDAQRLEEKRKNIIENKKTILRELRAPKLQSLDYKYQTVDSNLDNLTSAEVKKLKKDIELEKQRLRDLPETIEFPEDLNELIKFEINV